MAVENHYHNDVPASDNSAMTTIVAIIAVLFILGLGFFALQSSGYLRGVGGGSTTINNTTPAPAAGENGLNLDVNNTAPGGVTMPGGETNVNP